MECGMSFLSFAIFEICILVNYYWTHSLQMNTVDSLYNESSSDQNLDITGIRYKEYFIQNIVKLFCFK